MEVLCSAHTSTPTFLDTLIPTLMQKNDPFTQFVAKQNRNPMRRVCERLSREMRESAVPESSDGDGGRDEVREKICVLVALVCSYSFRLSNEETRLWLHFLTETGRLWGSSFVST